MQSELTVAPGLLIAMPQLLDPNFHKTVVLMLEHDDHGSFGLVVNRPGGAALAELLEGIEILWEGEAGEVAWSGGPVQPETGWILHEPIGALNDEKGTLEIVSGLCLSSAPTALRLVANRPPDRLRFILGYSGWGPGQLQHELAEGAWVHSDVTPEFLFDTPFDRMWDASLRRIGIDPDMLVPAAGVH